MAPSKEDGTAGAAEQLGTMSLGKSVERKGEPESENEDDTNGTPTKLCSACGEKSDTVKKCTACKCVWYCDKECQNKHWKEHKKECKRIKKELVKREGKLDLGTELDVGPLGKVPPQEECPICLLPLPINESLHCYANCCGKILCGACDLQQQIRSEIRAAESGQTPAPPPICAFCREKIPESNEEVLARARRRVERNDPGALRNMALNYGYGRRGISVDQAKCIELLRQSAGLGLSGAQYNLGYFHDTGTMGLEQNEKEAIKYYEQAAKGGDLVARHNIGCREGRNGNEVAAMRHCRLSASGGFKPAIENLIHCFENGLLRHSDLAVTLRAMYLARAEMKSEGRDKYIAHLKRTGQYEAEYEW